MSVRKLLRHLSERRPKINRGRTRSWPYTNDSKLSENSVEYLGTIPEKNFDDSRNTNSKRWTQVNTDKVQDNEFCSIIKDILTSYLEQFESYDHNLCSRLSGMLSDLIRTKVYETCGDNWKIIANVYIGAVRDQGIAVASQCAWIPECDKIATASFENDVLFAFGVVFAIFCETSDSNPSCKTGF